MWTDIGADLGVFEIYRKWTDTEKTLQEALFDLLIDLSIFAVDNIRTIDYIPHRRSEGMP